MGFGQRNGLATSRLRIFLKSMLWKLIHSPFLLESSTQTVAPNLNLGLGLVSMAQSWSVTSWTGWVRMVRRKDLDINSWLLTWRLRRTGTQRFCVHQIRVRRDGNCGYGTWGITSFSLFSIHCSNCRWNRLYRTIRSSWDPQFMFKSGKCIRNRSVHR
jgi:hypothetical protein